MPSAPCTCTPEWPTSLRRPANPDLLAACRRLWTNVVNRKMYVTGGIGSRHNGEAFGDDYELPNTAAYAETCAAIGLIFWAHRMLQLDGDARYADVMERALYNGFLAGVSLDGRSFFYANPLESDGLDIAPRHTCRRQEWFDCACCPTNVVRLLASLATYAYSVTPRSLYVHLYAAGQARTVVAGEGVLIEQATDYPWSGDVRLALRPQRPVRFELRLRIPAWCRRAQLRVNGQSAPYRLVRGYATITRTWSAGDRLDLSLAMPVERIHADPAVAPAAGRIALQRGPLVYCLEQADHNTDVRTIALPGRSRLSAHHHPRRLGGLTVLRTTGVSRRPIAPRPLYAPHQSPHAPTPIHAVPYYAWANRRRGPMTVWLPSTL